MSYKRESKLAKEIIVDMKREEIFKRNARKKYISNEEKQCKNNKETD